MTGPQSPPPSSTLVTLTAILLGVYGYFVITAWSSSSTDPQHGMADGFLMMVTLIIIGLAVLLWRAAARGAGGPCSPSLCSAPCRH